MKHIGRVVGLIALSIGGVASSAWAVDAAPGKAAPGKTAARPAAPPSATGAGPAVTDGTRSMGADELARMGQQVGAAPATTIYQATLKDGTFELSDRPPSGGATDIERRSYPLPQDAGTRQRADAERDYWRRQADAFERRRADRERDLERSQSARPPPPAMVIVHADGRRGTYHGYGWAPPDLFGGPASPGAFAVGGVAPVYTSSPGAVQGRDGGFIGSGFGVRP